MDVVHDGHPVVYLKKVRFYVWVAVQNISLYECARIEQEIFNADLLWVKYPLFSSA